MTDDVIDQSWASPHQVDIENYAAARVPMLPVVRGERETVRQIVLYTVALIAITMLPFLWGSAGFAYLASALFLA